MSNLPSRLSEICRTAIIVDLDDEFVSPYSDLEVENVNFNLTGVLSATSHTFLIYWPGGLATFLVERLRIQQLQPSHIEAAHRAAKQLKPFTPFNWRRGK